MFEVIQKIKIIDFNKNNNLNKINNKDKSTHIINLISHKLSLRMFVFSMFIFLNVFVLKSEDIVLTDLDKKDNIASTYKIGLAFQYNFLRNSLGFSEFTSTNRPDTKFNNYNDRFLSPKLYLEYFYRDNLAFGLNFSYNNMSYSDKLNEEFLVSNQGTPILATIQTITNAKINTFNISPKVLLNYENFQFETSMNVFFCLNQI